ncbi:MAG: YlmC/YmxH family sporulation protein [Lachnospirales bacterium]
MNCIRSLLNKEVVNIASGDVIGCVCDILIDTSCGSVKQLVVPRNNKLFSIFCKPDFIHINWCDVVKVGEDLILVSCNIKKG